MARKLITKSVGSNDAGLAKGCRGMSMQKNFEKNTDGSNGIQQPSTIPVVHEVLTVGKEVVVTGKLRVTTRTTEEEAQVNIPVKTEHYDVQRVSSTQVYDAPPPIRYEGDTMIVPVIEEIVVVTKRYKVIEEVRIVKQHTETPFMQEITLRKQHVNVERISPDTEDSNFNH